MPPPPESSKIIRWIDCEWLAPIRRSLRRSCGVSGAARIWVGAVQAFGHQHRIGVLLGVGLPIYFRPHAGVREAGGAP